jgi:hypothetical protein
MVGTTWKVLVRGHMDGPGDGGEAMLIALLAILGADLNVIVAFALFVLGRRRWLKRQPGEFAGAIRVSGGCIDGLSPKGKHGSGRWVREVLVWSKVAADVLLRSLAGLRRACVDPPLPGQAGSYEERVRGVCSIGGAPRFGSGLTIGSTAGMSG